MWVRDECREWAAVVDEANESRRSCSSMLSTSSRTGSSPYSCEGRIVRGAGLALGESRGREVGVGEPSAANWFGGSGSCGSLHLEGCADECV